MCDLTLCNLSTKYCKELVGRGLGLFYAPTSPRSVEMLSTTKTIKTSKGDRETGSARGRLDKRMVNLLRNTISAGVVQIMIGLEVSGSAYNNTTLRVYA